MNLMWLMKPNLKNGLVKSMHGKNLDYENNIQIEGVIDVGIIVIAHHTNPIQNEMVDFLMDIISGNRRILIPMTTFIGAYHILTRYLRVSRYNAKNALLSTLKLNSPYFYPRIDKSHVLDAIDLSSIFNIESWDGYLFALAKTMQTSHIYTIDKKLQKVEGFTIIYPVSDEKLNKYHSWLEKKNRSE